MAAAPADPIPPAPAPESESVEQLVAEIAAAVEQPAPPPRMQDRAFWAGLSVALVFGIPACFVAQQHYLTYDEPILQIAYTLLAAGLGFAFGALAGSAEYLLVHRMGRPGRARLLLYLIGGIVFTAGLLAGLLLVILAIRGLSLRLLETLEALLLALLQGGGAGLAAGAVVGSMSLILARRRR